MPLLQGKSQHRFCSLTLATLSCLKRYKNTARKDGSRIQFPENEKYRKIMSRIKALWECISTLMTLQEREREKPTMIRPERYE